MGVDLTALEGELRRIPQVTAAKIVVDEMQRPVEVHILATGEKPAKQIVRDVLSVATTRFGLQLDHRLISVVQLDTPPEEPSAEEQQREAGTLRGRASVEAIGAARRGQRFSVEVELRRNDRRAMGTAEGAAAGTVLRLVARATLDALGKLDPAAADADVEGVALVRVGEQSVALATVVLFVPPHEETLAGSALVRSAGEQEAVVRAVLDATTRRLAVIATDHRSEHRHGSGAGRVPASWS